jgi:hypothetical protein
MKELKKKQNEIDKKHKELFEQKQDLLNQANKIGEELLRLQGEYRLLENMINEEKSRGEKDGK